MLQARKDTRKKKGGAGLLKDECLPFSVKILVQQRCPAALKKKNNLKILHCAHALAPSLCFLFKQTVLG